MGTKGGNPYKCLSSLTWLSSVKNRLVGYSFPFTFAFDENFPFPVSLRSRAAGGRDSGDWSRKACADAEAQANPEGDRDSGQTQKDRPTDCATGGESGIEPGCPGGSRWQKGGRCPTEPALRRTDPGRAAFPDRGCDPRRL